MTQKEITYSIILNEKEDAALEVATIHKGYRTKSQFIRAMILEYVNEKGLNDKLNKVLSK